MNTKLLALPGLLLALVGCETVDSTAVTTAGVYANISAMADGTGTTRTTAVLKVGGATSNTYLDLIDADTLEATSGEETQTLSKVSIGDYREYIADWDGDAVDTEFEVSFLRDVDEGAPSTVVSLPEKFDIVTPSAEVTFSRSEDDILVDWDVTADEPMRVDISGDCFYVDAVDVDVDDGTAGFAAGSLEAYEEQEDETCQATISVWRTRLGDLDPSYGEGGVADGVQVRSITVLSAP
jgi:hypothetical protein